MPISIKCCLYVKVSFLHLWRSALGQWGQERSVFDTHIQLLWARCKAGATWYHYWLALPLLRCCNSSPSFLTVENILKSCVICKCRHYCLHSQVSVINRFFFLNDPNTGLQERPPFPFLHFLKQCFTITLLSLIIHFCIHAINVPLWQILHLCW